MTITSDIIGFGLRGCGLGLLISRFSQASSSSPSGLLNPQQQLTNILGQSTTRDTSYNADQQSPQQLLSMHKYEALKTLFGSNAFSVLRRLWRQWNEVFSTASPITCPHRATMTDLMLETRYWSATVMCDNVGLGKRHLSAVNAFINSLRNLLVMSAHSTNGSRTTDMDVWLWLIG